jgi:hypothetical protein
MFYSSLRVHVQAKTQQRTEKIARSLLASNDFPLLARDYRVSATTPRHGGFFPRWDAFLVDAGYQCAIMRL